MQCINQIKLTRALTVLFMALGLGLTAPSYAANVGYYDMSVGQGNATQVAGITAAGHTAVNIADPTAANLAGVDVLLVQNPSNSAYGAEYLSRLADIQAFVDAGGTLIIHDRFVDDAESILPAGGGFDVIRDFSDSADINILDGTTLVTNGPGGIVTNDNLDNGNSSSHGYSVAGSLPAGAALILTRGDADELVTFSYGHGEGCVVYSSIPLDFYIAGGGSVPALSEIYAPNVVAYGAAGCSLESVSIECPVQPDYQCSSVAEADINIKDGSGIAFEWRGSLAESVLGSPTVDTSHVMCMYRDGELISQYQVAPGEFWRERSARTDFKQKNGNEDGVLEMIFQASLDDAKGEVVADSRNLPELPINPSYSFDVQLLNDAGLCLSASFAPPLERDSGGRVRAFALGAMMLPPPEPEYEEEPE